ncbi:MAG TPA: o-succinylbenzoate synthase, partial [Candidatus Kapabacteria bacterium]|nr:o-succinylbenzoate synthase [Candidatus Kapabacteria bacterium]
LRSIRLYRVKIPFHEPFRIAGGEVSEKEAIAVEVNTADGITGFGEASPMAGNFYSSDTPDSAWKFLTEQLVPFALSLKDTPIEQFAEHLNAFTSEPFARAGLEGALWDAHSRQTGIPLYALLGGEKKDIPSGAAIGLFPTIDELLLRIEQFLQTGYQRIKIKIQPGWDSEPLQAIRERFGDIPLMVDANTSYSMQEHILALRELDQFGLMMIEQPLAKNSFEESAELQRQLKTPICADESAYSMSALEDIIRLGSAKIINIKVQRVGGLLNARRMAERTMQAGLPCWLGTMPELGIASAQGLHLATHPAFQFPTDIEASDRWYIDDIIEPKIQLHAGGNIALADWNVSMQKIHYYIVQSAAFSA